MKSALILLLALALPSPGTRSGIRKVPGVAPDRPNVLLLLFDDLGYGDLPAYGADDVRTPNIDRLAREGIRLSNYYASAPLCSPSRAGYLTGRYQQRAGIEKNIPETGSGSAGLAATQPSIARSLRAAGYETGLVGKWHLGFTPDGSPNAHGFDSYFGPLGNTDNFTHRSRNGTPLLYENQVRVSREGYMTDLIEENAVAFLEAERSGPFFLQVAFTAVHVPYQRPDRPDDVRSPATWYDGDRSDYVAILEHADTAVGRILEALDRRGLAERTLVILASDNGAIRAGRNVPLAGGKYQLWEGGIRVPCILRMPGVLPAGAVSSQAAISMDLTASILATAPLDGIDLFPLLRGERPPVERTLFWRTRSSKYGKQKAVRMGRWKYLRVNGRDRLFDLDTDLGERDDMSSTHPEILAEMRTALKAWEREVVR
jgi:arylsulfatase A-like enzyme